MIPGIQHRCIFLLIVAGWLATGKASTCNETLVDTVTNDKLTASSEHEDWVSAEKSRLSSSNGWMPEYSDHNSWIQVDFEQPLTVEAIVTKGSGNVGDKYVEKYMVKYSNATSSWITVTNGTSKEFTANSDTTTPVINNLPDPIVARYIRLYPTNCSGYCILRFDVIGCRASECSKNMVDNVTDDKLTASSSFLGNAIIGLTTPDMAKLSNKGWCRIQNDLVPWIQVNFGRHIAIKGVVSMGSAAHYAFVKEYRVNYSSTTSSWKTVVDAEFQIHTFTANVDSTTPVTNYLPSPIVARFVRLLPTDFNSLICLRFDIIGCEVTTPTSTTLAVSSSTTSTQSTLTTVNRQTTTTTLPEPTTTKFLSSPTTTMTLPSLITSATSGTSTSTTTLSSQDTTTTANTPTSPTSLYPPTTATTSGTSTSTTTLSSQDTTTTANIPTSPTTLYPPTTATTSGTSTSTTTLSSQDTTLYPPTTATTSGTSTSTTTISSQDTTTTANTPTSPTTLYPPTTATTSGTSTSTTTLSSQDTTTTANTPTSPTTLHPPTTASTSGTLTSITTLSLAASPATSTAVGATQFADTTFKPTLFNSTQVGFCTCICAESNDSMTPQKVQARIETIVQNLTVSKKKTSKYIRSKTSAQDSRPEVVYVGSVAIVILCMFASLIVLPDLYTLLRFIYAMLKCKEK